MLPSLIHDARFVDSVEEISTSNSVKIFLSIAGIHDFTPTHVIDFQASISFICSESPNARLTISAAILGLLVYLHDCLTHRNFMFADLNYC